MQMCSLRLQFADLFHDLPMAHKYCQSDWSFFFPKLVLKMSSIFSRNERMIPIVSFQSLGLFFNSWCSPATCRLNLISKTTWLMVKLELVNLHPNVFVEASLCRLVSRLFLYLGICIWI